MLHDLADLGVRERDRRDLAVVLDLLEEVVDVRHVGGLSFGLAEEGLLQLMPPLLEQRSRGVAACWERQLGMHKRRRYGTEDVMYRGGRRRVAEME